MKTLLASFVLWWLLAAAPVPASADDQFKVLVVAVPNRYHHDYTVVAKPRLEQMARQHGFGLDWAWNTAPFDADLSGFDAIVLLNTPGDELRGAQRAALEGFVRAGGGVVAVHRALIFNPPGDWPWFERMIGRAFRIHPMVQTALVRVEDASFPAAFALPSRWIWSDEWYEFGPPLVDGLRTVLSVDERSYDPGRIWPGQVARGMGADHPVAWYHAFDGGRVFVTALGHPPAAYDDADYLAHLYGGIWWAATGRGIDGDAGATDAGD
ncbi:ThuA domain-containing protein [Luteimonas sp. M1R5S18]|jgi:type 1 glutamine amidotransferase|uniref:ThuA domain-containing protein n=1 Tax=Luteimonas rhizosphaericola TaxID=3042024 RepID=A0ABT6JKK7_9GAMM|nr:ThuA domain-containing protein [Luteimonas rhizosphaericola]MDH5831200.1 ThuA domain-containing protein [Luteimonas rhizosphaericola]